MKYAEVYRAHPFYDAPDTAAMLRELIARPEFRATLDLA